MPQGLDLFGLSSRKNFSSDITDEGKLQQLLQDRLTERLHIEADAIHGVSIAYNLQARGATVILSSNSVMMLNFISYNIITVLFFVHIYRGGYNSYCKIQISCGYIHMITHVIYVRRLSFIVKLPEDFKLRTEVENILSNITRQKDGHGGPKAHIRPDNLNEMK